MIYYTFFSSALIIFSVYGCLHQNMLKRPWILLVIGVFTSALSVMIKSLPTVLKKVPAFKDAVSMDIAASVVDPTLIGLSGGLIASAFIFKVQQLYDAELISLASTRKNIELLRMEIEKDEEDLLSDIALDEFTLDERLKTLRERKIELIMYEMELKRDVRKLNAEN